MPFDLKAYFRIPFTWYYLGSVTRPHQDGGVMRLCLITKEWDATRGWVWKAIV